MAANTTSRSLHRLVRRARPSCECPRYTVSRIAPARPFSSSTSRAEEVQDATEQEPRPRWSYTPERMKAPFPWRIQEKKAWTVNDDPAKLDKFYLRFLGPGGDNVLTDEVKWLAITHKSFDQGRRGFNDRMAFLGRRILNLQTNLALLHSPVATQSQGILSSGSEGRTHSPLDGLANLSNVPLAEVLSKERLAYLATTKGMREIVRWVPKDVEKLKVSGLEAVLATSIYAIIGAIALQKGGDIAAQVAREKVLKPLGIL